MPKTYTKIVTFKMPPHLLEKLDEVSKRKGVTRSQLIREAIEKLLNA